MKACSGFTLLEAVVTIAVMSLLITFVMRGHANLSRGAERAALHVREARAATAVLDRLERDLSGAYLIRRDPETGGDPLEHPWLFVAEGRTGQDGADRVKFTTLSNLRYQRAPHRSDLATISWWLDDDGSGAYRLLRHVEPRLPEGLDRSFPDAEAPGVAVAAEGVAAFSLRFVAEDGSEQPQWDSSTLLDSSELPLLVDVSLALWPDEDAPQDAARGGADAIFLDADDAPQRWRRRIVLVQRPLTEREALGLGSAAAGSEEERDPNCRITWNECVALQDPGTVQALSFEIRTWLGQHGNRCLVGTERANLTELDLSRCAE